MITESGVSASAVADRLQVARSTISHYRRGRRPITVDVLEQLAAACGYTVRIALTPTRGYDNIQQAILSSSGYAADESGIGTTTLDTLDRPWVRTDEGWAPTRGNPLRVRLSWSDLQRLYGPTRPNMAPRNR